jgi:hypothetical protein
MIDAVESGGLSRPIRSNEPEDFTLFNLEAHLVYGHKSAEGFGEIL